jgi:hypothetical protein
MFTYSTFKHEWTKSNFPCNTPSVSTDYKVYVNGVEVPVYTCRISAYPLNRVWPGFQRPVAQTETASFVNLISDEEIKVEVQPESFSDNVRGVETLRKKVADTIKQIVGLSPKISLVAPGTLPRSEGKMKRVIDLRKK